MKVYVGKPNSEKVGAGQVAVIEGDDRRLLTHHRYHSPDGFSWGYSGSGPSELSRCLLWDLLGEEPDKKLYFAFRDDVIAHLPRTGYWTLTEQEVRNYIEDWNSRG